jgi:hypothetical protein
MPPEGGIFVCTLQNSGAIPKIIKNYTPLPFTFAEEKSRHETFVE